MSKTDETNQAVFGKGKIDGLLAHPKLTCLEDELWKELYEQGFQEGESLRTALQEADAHEQAMEADTLRQQIGDALFEEHFGSLSKKATTSPES